jgi:sulfite dehydrogenase (quinone) subunit SoeA
MSGGRASGRSPVFGARRHARRAGARPIPTSSKRYIENGSFFSAEIPQEAQFFKHANAAYQDFAVKMGFFDTPQPVTFQLYSEELQKFRLSAEGLREPVAPEVHRARILSAFTPLPSGIVRWRRRASTGTEFPYHAITQRPMAMYHSWGSMNAWLRQIHTDNRMFVPAAICEAHGWPTATGPGSSRIMDGSRCRSRAPRPPIATRCGPGTRSASARAPGA